MMQLNIKIRLIKSQNMCDITTYKLLEIVLINIAISNMS